MVYARGRRPHPDGAPAPLMAGERTALRERAAVTRPSHTGQYMLEPGLVRDAAEHPLDDALVELLGRHEAELGALLSAPFFSDGRA